MTWASGGHIPAYLPVVASESYQTLKPNVDYAAAGDQLAFEPNNAAAGAAGTIFTAATNFFNPAIDGRLPVDEAVEMFEQEVQSVLAS